MLCLIAGKLIVFPVKSDTIVVKYYKMYKNYSCQGLPFSVFPYICESFNQMNLMLTPKRAVSIVIIMLITRA